MRNAQAELDHALGNVAMVYGLNRAQLDEAKQHVMYADQVEILADHLMRHPDDGPEAARMGAALVLQSAGHFPKPRPDVGRAVRSA